MTSSQLYNIWSNMKQRCTNKKKVDYKYYGGKGIKYCSEWEKYSDFEKWALKNGYECGLTIDRIDFNKGYSPQNCRFITIEEQQRNKSNNKIFSYKGDTKTLSEWAREYSLPVETLRCRLLAGYDIEEALLKKKGVSKFNKKYEVNGEQYTLTELANIYNMSTQCLFQRLKSGWELEKALSTLKNHSMAIKIICLNTLEQFDYIKEATKKYGINNTCISNCCKGKQKTAGKINGEPAKWMYYEDYLKQMEGK